MVTQEQRQLFRLRLLDLRTYREQNPGKGYIEWKLYLDGGQFIPSYINRWTGKPIATGAVNNAIGLRDAADFTPIGDALTVKDAYNAASNNDWSGAGLALLSLIPFIPSSVTKASRMARPVPKLDRGLTDRLWAAKKAEVAKRNEAISKATNETYKVVERLMDDPAYINRAEEVYKRFGDNYMEPYADMFMAYNISPESLPNVQVLDDNLITAGTMTKTPNGEYIYGINPNMNIPYVTEHELSHYSDLLKTGEYTNAEAGNNMFYEMSKDLDKKVDKHDRYFKNPSEQKAHMNLLREYMFQNGYISTRDEKLTLSNMKKILKDIESVNELKSVRRATDQFKSLKTYTKWFNSIPLLGVGATAVYNSNNNKE